MTPKNIHKIFIPQKIFHFLKTPKNIEIQNFEPQKMTRAYVCMNISEYLSPPPPGTHGAARKSQTTIKRHQKDKVSKATSSLIPRTELFPIKMIAKLKLRTKVMHQGRERTESHNGSTCNNQQRFNINRTIS